MKIEISVTTLEARAEAVLWRWEESRKFRWVILIGPLLEVLFTSTEFYKQKMLLLHTINSPWGVFSLQLLDFLICSLKAWSMKGDRKWKSCFDLFQHNLWPEIHDIPEEGGKKWEKCESCWCSEWKPCSLKDRAVSSPLFPWSITAYNAAIILLGRCFITNLGLGGDERKFVLTFQGSHKREMMSK